MSRTHATPRRHLTVASALALVTMLAACSSSASHGGSSPSGPSTPATSTAPATTPVTTPPSSSKPASTKPVSSPPASKTTKATSTPNSGSTLTPLTAAQATAKIAQISRDEPKGAISVAAINEATGTSYSDGATSGMMTASIYKLFVLETLLLKRQGSSSTGLSDDERSTATRMIENSDNTAGYHLFVVAGGRPALTSAAATFGMTHTTAGHADPAFTKTSGTDYLKLLNNLISSKSPLHSASRSYVLGLMRNVEKDQRWGVGVVADKGDDFANKNGWLSVDNTNGPGEDDNNLWIATSVGIVKIKGQQVLMAILTQHQLSYDKGVALVQKLAKIVGGTVES